MRQSGHVNLIGTSPAILDLTAEVQRVARSDAKVLITGESGVGKDIVARAICAAGARADAAFIPVNCAGIPETLLESELFGHVKGSFTGAYRDKPGKLEMANGGTIFLDEIGEMTLRMQGLFLRFLETGELQKVGAERIATAANVRVIAATNRNLQEQITLGQFREDLFYRLNVIHLVVPPLRDRREDIPLLIEHFLRNFTSNDGANGNGNGNGHVAGNGQGNGNGQSHGNGHGNGNAVNAQANGHGALVRSIAPEAVAVLSQYSWPGNVRQLENVIERLVVTGRRDVVGVEDLPMEVRSPSHTGMRPKRDRRRTVADELFKKLTEERESFWTAVYPLYMDREITRGNVRDLVHKGLEEARGNYKIVLRMFNMESRDYKRFLNFLRKHDCQLPFKEYPAVAMYERYYGLRERPFDLLPNPRFLYLTPRHREAFSNLQYALSAPRGLTLLLGEAGTGKTTLVQSALAELNRDNIECVLVSNPTLTRDEFYEHLATSFGLDQDASGSKTRFLFEFRKHLQARHAAGQMSALVLDEAQSLPYELLEEVRLLSNIETATVKLLNVVLAGQPELATRLNEPGLRQLKQRISLRCQIEPLTFQETAAYIAGRLRIAGGNPAAIFSREAILAIHEASGGIPRIVNVICDNALIGGFAAEVKPVLKATVDEVCRDFDLGAASPAVPPAEAPAPTLDNAIEEAVAQMADAEPAFDGGAQEEEAAQTPMFGTAGRRKRFSFF